MSDEKDSGLRTSNAVQTTQDSLNDMNTHPEYTRGWNACLVHLAGPNKGADSEALRLRGWLVKLREMLATADTLGDVAEVVSILDETVLSAATPCAPAGLCPFHGAFVGARCGACVLKASDPHADEITFPFTLAPARATSDAQVNHGATSHPAGMTCPRCPAEATRVPKPCVGCRTTKLTESLEFCGSCRSDLADFKPRDAHAEHEAARLRFYEEVDGRRRESPTQVQDDMSPETLSEIGAVEVIVEDLDMTGPTREAMRAAFARLRSEGPQNESRNVTKGVESEQGIRDTHHEPHRPAERGEGAQDLQRSADAADGRPRAGRARVGAREDETGGGVLLRGEGGGKRSGEQRDVTMGAAGSSGPAAPNASEPERVAICGSCFRAVTEHDPGCWRFKATPNACAAPYAPVDTRTGFVNFICKVCKKTIGGMTSWTGQWGDGPTHVECRSAEPSSPAGALAIGDRVVVRLGVVGAIGTLAVVDETRECPYGVNTAGAFQSRTMYFATRDQLVRYADVQWPAADKRSVEQ